MEPIFPVDDIFWKDPPKPEVQTKTFYMFDLLDTHFNLKGEIWHEINVQKENGRNFYYCMETMIFKMGKLVIQLMTGTSVTFAHERSAKREIVKMNRVKETCSFCPDSMFVTANNIVDQETYTHAFEDVTITLGEITIKTQDAKFTISE